MQNNKLELILASTSIGAISSGIVGGMYDSTQNSNLGILIGAGAVALYPPIPFMIEKDRDKAYNSSLKITGLTYASYFTSYFLTRAAYSFLNQ